MKKRYVLGHSEGGFGTYSFIESDPKYIDVSSIKDIPMWIFFGDQDRIERARTVFAEMKEIGGNMKFTTWVGDGHPVARKMITGADNGVTQFSSDRCDSEPVFLKWVFAQKLTKERK